MEMEIEVGQSFLKQHSENILSLFQELRPRDPIELMMVTKIIILDHLSNREFTSSTATTSDERRTLRQTRGIKLSRLLLEFKDKFDKHRKPEQQIHVQHNHICNEGQAIIGSQLSTGRGLGKKNPMISHGRKIWFNAKPRAKEAKLDVAIVR